MKRTTILGTMVICAWLGAAGVGFGGETSDLLMAGRTNYEKIKYDPQLNLLTVFGGAGDDRIELALARDGAVLLNGVPLAKLGIRVSGIPVVAIHGGDGNDVLISRRLPVVALNGGEGQDILVWNDGDDEFIGTFQRDDILLCNSPETKLAFGGAGLDILIANTGGDRDAVLGGLGRDVLLGGDGADNLDGEIFGDMGNDWIVGGTGQD